MKKQLLKMLSNGPHASIALIVTAILFSVSANAQIFYTDVIPDTTVNTNNGVYHLDLNNDGITDFNITYTTSGSSPYINMLIRITPLGANKVGNDPTYPAALLLNALIDSSSFTWKNNSNQTLLSKTWIMINPRIPQFGVRYSGNWNGVSNKDIPLQLDVNSQKYYGWVRLAVPTGAVSFTVKDYAYNSIPSQPIIVGQNGTTGIIENSFASSVNIFPNPADNHLTISLGSNNTKADRKDSFGEVTITDITGKIIPIAIGTTIAEETQQIVVNTEDFKAGIYVVQIQTADYIVKKKLLIEK